MYYASGNSGKGDEQTLPSVTKSELEAIGENLISKIIYDSFKAGAFKMDKGGLLEQGIISGVNQIIIRDKVKGYIVSALKIQDDTFANFLVDTIDRSALDILYRMLMKQQYSMMNILIEQLIIEVLNFGQGQILMKIQKPANKK